MNRREILTNGDVVLCDCSKVLAAQHGADAIHRVINIARAHVEKEHHFQRVFLLSSDVNEGRIRIELSDEADRRRAARPTLMTRLKRSVTGS